MVCSIQLWRTRSQPPRHALSTTSLPGDRPDGEGTGTALVALGTRETQEMTAYISHSVGPGTACDANKGTLTQTILPCGRSTFIAKVYQRPRWSDGLACIMLDDAETSIIAYRGFDHRVGHCGVRHVTAASVHAACLRGFGLPQRALGGPLPCSTPPLTAPQAAVT